MSTVSAVSTALVALAVVNPGLTSPDVEVNDSGIWVTRAEQMLVGRFNYAAQTIDSVLTAGGPSFDVLQDGDDVLVWSEDDATMYPVDPATLVAAVPVHLPEGSKVALGDSVVAVYDGEGGSLWVFPFEDASTFSPDSMLPVLEGLEGQGRVAVGLDGTVYLATDADAAIHFVPVPDGVVGEPRRQSLSGVDEESDLFVTAVGDTPVALDRTTRVLYLPGGRVTLPDTTHAKLQRPGPAADMVRVATEDALLSQPLDGGRSSSAGRGGGEPAVPVVVGECAFAAWNVSGNARRDCPGGEDDYDRTVQIPEGASLRFRVNRGAVILNELTDGSVWLADQELAKVDDWEQALASNDIDEQQADTSEQSNDPLSERDLPNRPPVANDDVFGVRPGSSAILPVLYNDTDPDGDVLSASVSGAQPSLGRVEPIYDGAALQITVPEGKTDSTTFQYVADDGRTGGTDTATVTVSVHPDSVNAAPTRMRQTTADVEARGTIDIRSLDDWVDPDGDALLLTGASVETGDEVRFRADGLLTFVDKGLSEGVKKVTITVSDGRGGDAQGTISVTVHPKGDLPPDTKADHVSTTVGRTVTVEPLANDLDPNGDTLQLARVDADDAVTRGARVEPNFSAGTFAFSATSPGVYYVTYLATDGLHPVLGLVRVDVLAAENVDKPPVAVLDTALLPAEGSVLVDVLANDTDPTGGVLVVQSVDVDPTAGISVAVLEHRILRISAVRDLAGVEVGVTYRVSNGVSAVDGHVRVIPLSRPEHYQPPLAAPDEALVRVGDVVTIPVLANDSHPDGLPFTLVRSLASDLDDPSAGMLVTTDGALRFQAGSTPGTVHAVYEIVDTKNQRSSAQVTITIRALDAEHNSPPRPVAVTSRVFAGGTVRVAVPLDGIDPEGDSVRLVGVGDPPTKGRVVAFGDGWLDYQAAAGLNGTDSFTYVVEDALGMQASGSVTVGIAPPPGTNLPPIAIADAARVRPSREVSIPVMVNDTDPEGGVLQLVDGALDGLDAERLDAVVDHDRVVVLTPAEEGVYALSYTVQDDHGQRGVASITVTVSTTAEAAVPVARDDLLTLADVLGKEAVAVPVLDNDVDPDGSTSGLKVSLVGDPPDGVTVADGKVAVPIGASTQLVPYRITDPDGLTATAFVRVPGVSELRPTLKPGVDPLVVPAGTSVEIDLADWVVVADGKTVRITDPGRIVTVGGIPSGGQDGRRFTFTAAEGYAGPAAAAVEVIDTEKVDDPTGLRAVITIPVTVTNTAVPPTFAAPVVDVEPGREPGSIDLSTFVDLDAGSERSGLAFDIVGDVPEPFTARIDGHDLRVSVDQGTPTGTMGTLQLSVTTAAGQTATAPASLRVVPSSAPLVTANDDLVPDAQQGKAVTVRVLDNDVDPFPGDKELDLISATPDKTVSGADVQVDGDAVLVRPPADFHGTMVVRYQVGDRTKDATRYVDGRIELTVKGAPEAPLAPSIAEVRSRTVVLSWSSPADNGAPIDHYEVRSSSGPAFSSQCPSTTCILEGLENDREYTFQVVAVNEVGPSAASPASAVARPDARPDPPAAPNLQFGDGELAVRWTNAVYTDRSAITSVNLRISPAPASGQSEVHDVTGSEYTWAGLTNGTAYQVSVQAVNRADEPSDWGAASAPEVPAAPPDAPPAPRLDPVVTIGGNPSSAVRWEVPSNDNGDSVAAYTLRLFHGGDTPVSELKIPANACCSTGLSMPVSETPYTATVTAWNKAGEGPPSAPSAPRQFVLEPGPVSALTATALDRAAQLAFSPGAGNGATPGQIRYQYSTNGLSWNDLASDKIVRNLANNSVYTIWVRAVATVDGVEYLGWAQSVPNVAPYGPPGTPSVSASQGTTWVHVCWSPPGLNGRSIRVETNIDGGGWSDRGLSGCQDVGNGYNQPHSISARTVDSAGQVSATASDSANSSPPPTPRVYLTRDGGNAPIGQYLVAHTQNLPAGTYDYKCYEDDVAFADGSGNAISMADISFPANGSVRTGCYVGTGVGTITLKIFNVPGFGTVVSEGARW